MALLLFNGSYALCFDGMVRWWWLSVLAMVYVVHATIILYAKSKEARSNNGGARAGHFIFCRHSALGMLSLFLGLGKNTKLKWRTQKRSCSTKGIVPTKLPLLLLAHNLSSHCYGAFSLCSYYVDYSPRVSKITHPKCYGIHSLFCRWLRYCCHCLNCSLARYEIVIIVSYII